MTYQIRTVVSERVRIALEAIGRTEDIKFSPDYRLLALAGFRKQQILFIRTAIKQSAAGKEVVLSDCMSIASPTLHCPHGLSFIDDQTLIVANRRGEVHIFALPPFDAEAGTITLAPLHTIAADETHHVKSPGAVVAYRIGLDLYEVLICNTFPHQVTRHILDARDGFRPIRNEVLLSKELEIPDGIAIDKDLEWIAVSNHNRHSVSMYENVPALHRRSDPDGVLRKATFPHGLRFTPDGNFLLAADAGAPCVHLYDKNGADWRGERDPLVSLKVMDDKTYAWGRDNPKEGGPKGIDVTSDMRLFVTTCDQQTIAFFDLEKILEEHGQRFSQPSATASSNAPAPGDDAKRSRDVLVRELLQLEITDTRLARQKADLDEAFARQIQAIHQSPTWRLGVPIRWVESLWRTLRIKREQLHNRTAKLKRMLKIQREHRRRAGAER